MICPSGQPTLIFHAVAIRSALLFAEGVEAHMVGRTPLGMNEVA